MRPTCRTLPLKRTSVFRTDTRHAVETTPLRLPGGRAAPYNPSPGTWSDNAAGPAITRRLDEAHAGRRPRTEGDYARGELS